MKRLVLLLLTIGLSACASGRAQVIEDRPTLAVPPVPPRTIEAQPPVEPPAAEPIVEPVPPLPPAPKPRPNRSASNSNTTEPKPDPKPEQTGEAANAAAPNSPPVAALRTPSTPSGPEATRQVKEALQRTNGILSKVDYQKLSTEKRENYDMAKAWMQQADDAIKKDDLRLALSFAERAENIAKQLESR
jgi:outer membrane biosynthesis protein TonB